MSRYPIPTRDPGLETTPPRRPTEAVVGWDPPLATFFAQVGPAPLDEADDGELVVWVGWRHGEITTTEALAACLARYAEVPADVMAALAADAREQPAAGPASSQQTHVHTKEEQMAIVTRSVDVYLNDRFADPSIYLDGYRPGEPMRLAISYESSLPDALDVCEEAFTLFNVGDGPEYGPNPIALRYRAAGNRSLCVGDVVVVDGRAYRCDPTGFSEAPEFEAPTPEEDPGRQNPGAGEPVVASPGESAPAAHARRRGWEVFDPADGRPIRRLPFRWMAHLAARAIRGDYARPGEGW